MCRQLLVFATLCLPISCVAPRSSTCGLDDLAAWSAPPLNRAVSVRDGRTGELVSLDALLDTLADADVVFLGESHVDETTHRVELAVYAGLLERRGGRVVLSLEMFERDVQQDLDAYLAGDLDEAAFLARARPWGNYRSAYRPLIEMARASGRPVVASNFPRPLLRRVAMEGPAVIETLEGADRRQAPAELLANTTGYWRRVDNAVRSHRAMMGGGGDGERLYSTQSLWDNAMGEACAVALDEYPGDLVLNVNGGFHSEYWDGTVRQLLLRKPKARVVTVAIAPVVNPAVAEVTGAPSVDYVVFAEARATDLNDGTWSVYTQRELEYRFALPDEACSEAPVPLLIWLSDDGSTAAEGLDLWKDRLGDHTAIAVLEAPYRQIGADLGGGGRWFWEDTFASDVVSLVTAVEGVWGYLLRHYPIDPTRVCVAGEGTGATVVAAVALLTDRMDLHAVAISPRRYTKIKDFPLPLPEFQGDDPLPEKSLRVVAGEQDDAWWAQELQEYTNVGLDNALEATTDDPWTADSKAESALRTALGLEERPVGEATPRRYILADGASARAGHWARLLAQRCAAEGGAAVAVLETPPADAAADRIPTDIQPEAFSRKGTLPRCPGPFGGTTVVVLPDGTTPEDLEVWLALEKDDPLTKQSRFRRLRIATTDGELSLPDVLAKLRDEGRENALIVPATFCANAASMHALKRSVRALEDQMTLHWRPGLGGRDFPVASTRAVEKENSPEIPPRTRATP